MKNKFKEGLWDVPHRRIWTNYCFLKVKGNLAVFVDINPSEPGKRIEYHLNYEPFWETWTREEDFTRSKHIAPPELLEWE